MCNLQYIINDPAVLPCGAVAEVDPVNSIWSACNFPFVDDSSVGLLHSLQKAANTSRSRSYRYLQGILTIPDDGYQYLC